MTDPRPNGPSTAADTGRGGCEHWFYRINLATHTAQCQDCPRAWTLPTPRTATAVTAAAPGSRGRPVSDARSGDR
jgi:hypothetical protein